MTSLSLNRHPARALRPGLLGILLSLLALLLLALFSIGCSAGQQPTATVSVDVAPLLEGAVESDVGYAVTLTGARLSVADILLKDGEDEHTVAGLLRSLGELVIPSAHAHPGHGAGGVVIGELLGRRIVDFGGGRVTLGEAEAVLADLDSVDFLRIAATADDVGDDDPLLGHAAVLTGSATDGERTVVFEARIGVDDDTAVQGAPLSPALTLVEGDSGTVAIALQVGDPFEDDTLFDGVDFGAAADASGVAGSAEEPLLLLPGDPDHNRVRRGLVSHDHYVVLSEASL